MLKLALPVIAGSEATKQSKSLDCFAPRNDGKGARGLFKAMNILYLTNHLNTGGISSYVITLAKGFKNKGHNVYIACGGGELVETLKNEGINYIPIPIKTKAEINPKILISLFLLRKVIREKNIEIVHANTRVTQVLACSIRKFIHRPFISTCHGFFKKRLFRRIAPCWGSKVIAISQQVKEHLAVDFGLKEEDIRIVHNGIDLARFDTFSADARRLAQEKFGITTGPVIGIIARLSDVKGHKFLLEALPRALAQFPDAKLLIIGDGRQKHGLLKLSRELKIEKNCIFLPTIDDTRQALGAMDLFVMPSLKEGLGLALMEAMACGLAVIGSDVGGIKTLLSGGKNGLLVPPSDSIALAAAVIELLKDRKKQEELGRNAREFIRENFSQEKMVEETERVYQECLSQKS